MSTYRTSETLSFEPGTGTVLTITYAPCPDEDAARELEMWKDNTQELYDIEQWVIERSDWYADRGKYDHQRLIAGLENMYYKAAKHYCDEFGCSVRTTFPKTLRTWMAERDAEEHRRTILNW